MKKSIYIACLAILAGFTGQGQIAAWDFFGQSFPVTCAATTFHLNLDTLNGADNITRGSGAPASGGVHSFRTTGFQNNGISTASSDYFQITLKALPGYKLSLSSLDAKFNGTASFFSAPGVISQFAYSLDGVSFMLIGNPVQSTSLTMGQINLTGIADLQHVYSGTTVTLRYFASGQTTTGGWGFYSASSGANGLTVGGTVTEALVITPAIQSSGITFSNIQQTQMGLLWTPGDGEKRVVKINTFNSFTDPANGTDPAASPVYSGSGEQVIYNYSGSAIPAVTGLAAGVTYWYRIWEYNGSGVLTLYNTLTALNNPSSQASSAVMLVPAVSSPTATMIGANSANLGGHITSDGGNPVLERGTVWSTTPAVTMNDHKMAEGNTDTGYFSHQRNSLPSGAQIYYSAYAMNATGTAMAQESTFYTLANEPPAHVTGFTATSAGTTTIGLSWNPAAIGTDGYLILQKQGMGPPAGVPSDGNQYPPGTMIGDGTVAANVAPGSAGSQVIAGLAPGTAYSFTIFPYAWNGMNPQTTNFLSLSPVPWSSATTGIPASVSYHWTGASGNDWNIPGNWNPVRTVPALNDVLIFETGGGWTIINVPAQTIGQLKVQAGTGVTLQGAGSLSIAGDSGDDLAVEAGCQLNITGTGTISISLAAGATGAVNGAMTFSGGGHRLTASSLNGVVFAAGSMFKTGSGFTGNPFGTLNLNSVVFSPGSAYICLAGGNPFGAAAPASVVVFQPGSLYRIDAYAVPSFGGRIYGNFEMNYAGSITVTGSSAVSIDNFTASQGTFYFNVTGTPGHSIKGNIFVANVATLIFAPATAGTVMLNGTIPQAISGSGSIMAGTFSTLVMGNSSGVTLNMDARLNHLTITAGGVFTIAPDAELTVTGEMVNSAPASGFILEPGGSLIHNSVGVTGTVKRFVPAATWTDWQDGWHFISSPVADQSINTAGGFITTGADSDFDLLAWSESYGMWVNYKNTTIQPYFSDINGGNNFVPGRGYLAAYQQAGVKNFEGMLNVSDLPVENLTNTSATASVQGWHLLGNPFSCALSWYNGWAVSNIGGVAYIWNEAGLSYTPRNPGEAIPACNGFMVQVTGSQGNQGSLIIPAAGRIHNSQGWFKEPVTPAIKLLLRNMDFPSFQESQIRFNPLSTMGFDPEFDGRFLPGYAPLFYSKTGEEKLAVNSIPGPEENLFLPFTFIKNAGSHFQIESRISGELASMVLLTDKKTGSAINLGKDSVYAFTSEDGDDPDRFGIRFLHAGVVEVPGEKPVVSTRENNILVACQGDTRIEILSIVGKTMLLSEQKGAGTEKISLHVPDGWYLVRVTAGGRIKVAKVYIHTPLQ